MVGDCFTEDFAPRTSTQLEKFCDYLVENIGENSPFPPSVWLELSDNKQRTYKACKVLHSKFNSLFYSHHPDIFKFVEILKQVGYI